ncbi:MAG: HAMP domain-containing protein [Clostridia bacterium]|nr:HAMP domain-containing protein [Clostridia bacterium]
MKRKGKTNNNLTLRETALLLFFAALLTCILLTTVLFSIAGRSVYLNIVAGEMREKAKLLSEEAVKYMNGEITEESFRFMIRSTESRTVILNKLGEQTDFNKDRRPDLPGGQAGPKDGEAGAVNDEVLPFLREEYPYVTQDTVISRDNQNGIIAAAPIVGTDGETLGVVFLIREMSDIRSTSRSLLVVLIISSLAVGAIMAIPLYFLSKWLTRPLANLTSAAVELSSGNYEKRVEPEGSYEVRELGSAFNTLAGNLKISIGELTVERNRLRAVLESIGEGLIGFDASGRVSRTNNSALELLGVKDPEKGVTLPENVHEAVKAVLETGESRTVCFASGERVIRMNIAVIEEEKGRVSGAVALLMDVTEAERLEQTRRDYVANVSHELRTPLASIRGIADMLNDGLVKDEGDKLRYYGYILKESIRLSTLINDLLELSRLQSGGVALRTQHVELYELIADVADRMSGAAKEHGMNIVMRVPEGEYHAFSNPDRVEQVMITLIDNAVKHGTEGGDITVDLYDRGGKWAISVKNPAEIDENDICHLFERFFKADKSHSSEGTGLGLAIAEEVLTLLGESISANYEDGIIELSFTVTKQQ